MLPNPRIIGKVIIVRRRFSSFFFFYFYLRFLKIEFSRIVETL